jgi:hypothetical protein
VKVPAPVQKVVKPSVLQYFHLKELGVKVELRHNCMILLNTTVIHHYSAPAIAVGGRNMYGTALHLNADTLSLGAQHVDCIIQLLRDEKDEALRKRKEKAGAFIITPSM